MSRPSAVLAAGRGLTYGHMPCVRLHANVILSRWIVMLLKRTVHCSTNRYPVSVNFCSRLQQSRVQHQQYKHHNLNPSWPYHVFTRLVFSYIYMSFGQRLTVTAGIESLRYPGLCQLVGLSRRAVQNLNAAQSPVMRPAYSSLKDFSPLVSRSTPWASKMLPLKGTVKNDHI